MTPGSRLRLLTDIGADRYLSREELRWPATLDHAWIDEAWRVYTRDFNGFTGSRLDPDFERFHHPAASWGSVQAHGGCTAVIAGLGPAVAPAAATLRRVRDRLLLVTSPGGAAGLAGHGLSPDLIIVDQSSDTLAPSPAWVAAELRTPPARIEAAVPSRLFVPHAWPGWGSWPATATAIALAAGSRRVILVGIDASASTASLLTLLARTGMAECLDAGAGCAPAGWEPCDLTAVLQASPAATLHVDTWPIGARYFIDEAARWRTRADPLLWRTRQAIAMTGAVRDGAHLDMARAAAKTMLGWGGDPAIRSGLQDVLGLARLPRLWRSGAGGRVSDELLGALLPALHEAVTQFERLDALLAQHTRAALA